MKYFQPIDFPEIEETEKSEPQEQVEESLDIAEKLKRIRKDIELIQAGQSPLKKIGVHFPKGESPVLTALHRLERNPTKRNVWQFLILARQDLGRAAAQHFAALLDVDPTFKDKI